MLKEFESKRTKQLVLKKLDKLIFKYTQKSKFRE